jgi:hypothetical protein
VTTQYVFVFDRRTGLAVSGDDHVDEISFDVEGI